MKGGYNMYHGQGNYLSKLWEKKFRKKIVKFYLFFFFLGSDNESNGNENDIGTIIKEVQRHSGNAGLCIYFLIYFVGHMTVYMKGNWLLVWTKL